MFSRNGNDMTATYPELTDRDLLAGQDFIADGEIIAVGPSGRPDFGVLQGRMKLTRPADVAKARAAIPVRLMLFDLLSDGGKDLRRLPFGKRRARLEEFSPALGLPGGAAPGWSTANRAHPGERRELGLEGVMAKRTDSRYVSGSAAGPGSRSSSSRPRKWWWAAGGRARAGGGQSVGSLLVGIPDGAKLRYVGRVGSGFSTARTGGTAAAVDGLARKTSPFDDVPGERRL